MKHPVSYVFVTIHSGAVNSNTKTGKDYEKAIKDIEYFREKMLQLRQRNQLNDVEIKKLSESIEEKDKSIKEKDKKIAELEAYIRNNKK